MMILMYKTYNSRPIPRIQASPRKRKPYYLFGGLILFIIIYISYALMRSLPGATTAISSPVVPALIRVNIPWPATGQSAFGADGYGLLAHNSTDGSLVKPVPMASVAKVITALAILDKKPLKPGDQGSSVAFTQADVDIYSQYVAKDGSVVPVTAGGSMTVYQSLQAIMLASANNIADTMVISVFGSMEAYALYANEYVKKLGMAQTTITDASGFAPTTVSTAQDLVRLGDAALDNPVLSEIMAQKSFDFPGIGTVRNNNELIGQTGIRGIKTGTTNEAGGCYLAVADIMVNGKKIAVITAILGAPTRTQALKSTLPLIQSSPAQFQNVQVLRSGQSVGKAMTVWGASSDITAADGINVIAWTGTSLSPIVSATKLGSTAVAGEVIGNLDLKFNGTSQSSALKLTDSLSGPSLWWRLTHPY